MPKKRPCLWFDEPVTVRSESVFEFDDLIMVDNIMSITDIRTSDQNRKKCLAYAAFVMTKASCGMLADVEEHEFEYSQEIRKNIRFENALASVYILADAMTAPIHNTKYKMIEVEGNALESCMIVCHEHANR